MQEDDGLVAVEVGLPSDRVNERWLFDSLAATLLRSS
jgi:hypothetical protein